MIIRQGSRFLRFRQRFIPQNMNGKVMVKFPGDFLQKDNLFFQAIGFHAGDLRSLTRYGIYHLTSHSFTCFFIENATQPFCHAYCCGSLQLCTSLLIKKSIRMANLQSKV